MMILYDVMQMSINNIDTLMDDKLGRSNITDFMGKVLRILPLW